MRFTVLERLEIGLGIVFAALLSALALGVWLTLSPPTDAMTIHKTSGQHPSCVPPVT